MVRRIPILLSLVTLAACGGAPPPPSAAPKPAAAAPKKAAPAATEKQAETGPTVEYAYSPVGKRDPFRSVVDDQRQSGNDGDSTRPDCGPLCKWEIDQLKLVAVISGIANPLAMVEDPNGRGYVVRRGTFVGKRNGKVTLIRSAEIVVTEIYKDQMGKPHVNPVPIKLPDEMQTGQADDQNLLTPEVAE